MNPRIALAGAVMAAAVLVAPLAQAASFTLHRQRVRLPWNFDPSPSVPGLGAGSNVKVNGDARADRPRPR